MKLGLTLSQAIQKEYLAHPTVSIAESYIYAFEHGLVIDSDYYSLCVDILNKYGLRNKPFVREVNHETSHFRKESN